LRDELMDGHVRLRSGVCDRTLEIRTPENIQISYRIAGAGSRGAAFLVDSVILFCAVAVMMQGLAAAPQFFVGASSWVGALAGLLVFLVYHGYFVWFEWKAAGMTPGKKMLGIRVIKEGGYALGFTDALLRNLLRAVDFLPVFNAVGFASIGLTARAQRLGDLVAGTVVVHRDEVQAEWAAPQLPLPPRNAPLLPAHQLLRLPAQVHDLAVEFFRYVDTLAPAYRQELAAAIVDLVRRSTGLAPAANQSSEGFLAALVTQAGRFAPAAAEPPPAGTPPPFSPSGAQPWSAAGEPWTP
jgi:uncharacterized RDD family membrane protein YckC